MAQSLPDWVPDWAVRIDDSGPVRDDATEGATPLRHLPPPTTLSPDPDKSPVISRLLPSSHTPDTTSDLDLRNVATPVRKERTVAVTPNQNRTVHRKLQGIHLFVSPLKIRG